MPAPAITLLTDFGTADGYVAEMKGVLLSEAPGVPLVDLAHDVPAQDVALARLTVARYWRRFPVGTVHLVVVDPGVGSARAALAIASEGRLLVGPDNGVLSPALFSLDAQVVSLPVPRHASATFHGRDLFAPVAAQLAMGATLATLGEPYHGAIRLRTPVPRRAEDGGLYGEVLTIDRFGNAITNLPTRLAIGAVQCAVQCAGRQVPLVRSYADAAPGQLIALVGSSGFIEVAVVNGSAARQLALTRGTPVSLPPPPAPY
jgi:S-adenosylmethionine hydrolase